MRDVAARAGVSSTTVSMVLNGKDNSIGARTKDRVLHAAKELGYRPNVLAQALRSLRTGTVGFISDDVATTPHAGAMIQGTQEVASRSEYVLLLGNTVHDHKADRRTIEAMLDRRIDAAIYATMSHQVLDPPDELTGLPLVILNSRPRNEQAFSWVAPDEAAGARAAVEHLADTGHRRIGFVNVSDNPPAAVERRDAMRAFAQERGLHTLEVATADDGDQAANVAAATTLLDRPAAERPTALFCFNDRIAVGAYIAARRLGLSIPNHLSIVGFDNQVLLAEAVDPGLTSVQLPHGEMGQWAMEQVISQLQQQTAPQSMRMPCPLVERGSVCAPSPHN